MKKKIKEQQYLHFLKEYAFKKKLLLSYIIVIGIIILTAGISLVNPKLQGKIIDDLSHPHTTSLPVLMMSLIVFLVVLLFSYLMNYMQRYIVSVISEEIAAEMRQKVEDKLTTVKTSFFEKIKLSEILLKVDKDVIAIKQCGITSIIGLVSNIIILIIIPPYMLSIHKGIAISNIVLFVSVPFISKIMGKLIQDTSEKVLKEYNSTTNVLTNTYNNWFITRIFQCGAYIHDKYFEKNQQYKKEINRQNLFCILNVCIILVIQFLGTVIIWVVGAQEVFRGNMTTGTIITLMNYQGIIMNPILGIAQFANEYHTAVVSLKDINQLLRYPDQTHNSGEEVDIISSIRLERMSFSYAESGKKVFNGVNLDFKKGLIYGIHGKSGRGKSTLFKIITGVYELNEGKLFINDTELQDIDISSYWKNVGYVMQQTQFFNDAVRKNMELMHIVSKEELDFVSECLDLYDEIYSLEKGWDTEIKMEPCNFSEGQMVRLDIMRNVLKKAQLLIFDEVTANIDGMRRQCFYQMLHKLAVDKIIIFSTHNIEELKEADIIVDLEKMNIGREEEYL